ncbi:zinc finger protein 358-like isoform X2 [Sinocyclocheilus grahami]|uniref:zinc finger protein 358-like isoform X1 n=1 Tax=Sinocyclocheilus grahami TaxID=75366 RepID=UPI0007AD23A7|nr:PREDICTED: zinc finger protein 358-like isoform X1 [Sinocyclocheilus grahami]XP_016095505.1 PREDICTED: zinc finger protein 358-like isoform X2 [Sinocyclocheilus grahami]
MSEALFLTFQSQLSVVMETVLKSAMFEITRLVEDSFLEEVGHRKQEVEVLKRRLQLSESKLREREREWERGRKTQCPDCGRTGDSSSRDESQPVETVRGADSLCLGLSLRDQSTNQPTLTEDAWSARQHLESNKQTTAHSHSKERNDVHPQNSKEIVTPNSNAQIHQDFLQRLLCNSAVHSESTSDFKPRVSDLDKSEKNVTLDKEMDSNHSKLLQSPLAQDVYEDLPSSSPNGRVKTETELDLLPVKEEEEMVPVWDSVNRDDGCHAEMADPSQGELRVPCDQEEIQVESFPGLNSLDMPDATSYFTPYSVSTLVHQGIRAQHSHLCTTELMLSSIPERSHSFVQPENGHRYPGSKSSVLYSHNDVCPGEKAMRHEQYPKCFSQDKHGTPEQIHAERSHHCTQCGKTFARACDLKAHSLIHKGKKPLSCPQCDQTFAYNFELKAHQRNHSGERPHICPHCGKAFARMSNFRQHQNIHTREKLFSCTQCGMRFNRATNLRVHLRRHSHAGKTYNCPFCGKSFLNPRQMKAHLQKAHGRGGK